MAKSSNRRLPKKLQALWSDIRSKTSPIPKPSEYPPNRWGYPFPSQAEIQMRMAHVYPQSGGEFEKGPQLGAHYNISPPGLTRITDAEFAQNGFFTWQLVGYETRSCPFPWDNTRRLHALQMFHFNTGFGYAVCAEPEYVANCLPAPTDRLHCGSRESVLRYFRFGCVHQFRLISQEDLRKAAKVARPGICLKGHSICARCGELYESVDSSG